MNPMIALVVAAAAVLLALLMAAWALMERGRANRAEARAWEAAQRGADPAQAEMMRAQAAEQANAVAKALIKDYGKPVEFKMLVTATPRGRTVGQVLQQFWKRAGAEMEIEQVDQATIPPRAFMRQFHMTHWRIVDLPRDLQTVFSPATPPAP